MSLPFLWGAATSAHQVEGNNRASDWWAWEQAGKVKFSSGAACDQYNRFAQDIDLISSLGHPAHRFSLEWSRLEPRENEWDPEAFEHYRKMFELLKARGIEPVVTLHHFTNPQWFAESGGWSGERAVFYFVRFVKRAVEAYRPYVRFWVTLNEPLIFLYFGYMEGVWPPGRKSFAEAIRVFRHLVHAHVESYRAIHHLYEGGHGPAAVSIAHHMTYFEPYRESSRADRFAIWLRDAFVNQLFFRACTSGFFFFPGFFCEFLPLRRSLDYLGVNYYQRNFIRYGGFLGDHVLGITEEEDSKRCRVRERNEMGWDICPEGLYQVLRSLKDYKLPIMILENGICAKEDSQRVRFIQEHLGEVKRARQEGIPVWGYFYWSLIDNFEWHHGFGPRFGVVEVDYPTQQRKPRPSAKIFTDICRNIGSGEISDAT